MPKIAVVLIVKNEEDLLSRCLDSVKGFDELIICDTGSDDKTVEIAKGYTDKVYTDYTWEDSFCKARNHALSKVPDDIDWILSMDADEFLVTDVDGVYKTVDNYSDKRALDVTLIDERTGGTHWFPRLFKHDKGVYWINDAHNLLNIAGEAKTGVEIVYGYSPAHKKDPDRTMRILLKSLEDDPTQAREKYYLAKEYKQRGWWQKAIDMFEKYVKESDFLRERDDAYLQMARCYSKLGKYNEACDSAWEAIKSNANFKEALLFIADSMGPMNKERWLSFAELADNRYVLFNRTDKDEKGSDYYDKLFEGNNDMSRYENIHDKIAELVGKKTVLDIGCGLAKLADKIKNYAGFDFSEYAIEQAQKKYPKATLWVGDAYDKENYEMSSKKDRVYICTEVLEHVDDKKVVENIPSGSRLIFSVPSFDDPSHLRRYTEDVIKMRLPVNVKEVYRFDWNGDKWVQGIEPSNNYILLVDSTVK
jgi:glycosyltransferase involved in cell wall biosynthesis